jgi:hypothetical protein
MPIRIKDLDYSDENHSYSPLVILTGAGASKACRLSDMRQFAKDFYTSMSGQDTDNFDQELVCRLIYGQQSIKGNPEPKRDLEALLDGLTRLGEGPSGSCATTSVLLSIAGDMSNELASRLYNLTQKSEELVKKSQEQISYSGKINPNPPSTITIDSLTDQLKIHDYVSPVTLQRFNRINLNNIEILGSPISYETDVVRDASKSAHSFATERNKALKELPQRAKTLALRVKEKIRDAYSVPSLPSVQRVWDPTFQVLRLFESQTLDLFTLNYDPVIEMFCQNKDIPRTCGFVSEGQEFVWRNDFTFPQPKPTPRIRLYKIHGSVSWKGFEDRIVETLLFGPGTVRDLSGHPAKDMLIYPVTGKAFYGEPYFTLINHFRQALLNARCCLIIGFSYRDEMVVDLLRFACRENSSIKFIHCGMAQSKLRSISHLSEVLPRTEFTSYKFGHPKFADELRQILSRQFAK